MIRIKNILIFLLVVQFFSCKKETDENGPKVNFSSPFDNQNFMVYDNIPVKAYITDETSISSVAVTLVNDAHVPVHRSISVPVSSPSMSMDLSYPLDNVHLESGQYYLMVTASDGKNISHSYQPVTLTGVPRQLKKIFVATAISSASTNMYVIDSTFSGMILYSSFSGDYLGTSSSSYYQQVFLCGNYTGSFTSKLVADKSTVFNVSPLISSAPYFTAYYSEDKKVYLARFDEVIKGYNNSGNIIFNGTANPGYYVSKLGINNGFVIAAEKSKTSSSRLIVSFYSTGTPEQQVAINQDVVSFLEKDDHNVFVFGNDAGQGKIQLYDRLANSVWDPYPYALAPGTILSAVKIDEDTYLFGHSNGTIYKYQYTSSSLTTYLSGYTAIQLAYDELNNDVYIGEQNVLTAVDYPSKSVQHVISCPEPLLGFSLLYNK
jgi:hypothetical protein